MTIVILNIILAAVVLGGMLLLLGGAIKPGSTSGQSGLAASRGRERPI